jgi:UPF0755 protein
MTTVYDVEQDRAPERGPRRRWPLVLLAIAVAVLLIGGIAVFWVQRQINPSGSPGKEVQITVSKGMSTDALASLLEKRGVISNATVFSYYAKINGADTIQAGEFTLRQNQHMGDVIKILEAGPKPEIDRVTIPEGFTLKEIANRVGTIPGKSADRFLAAANTGAVRSQYEAAGSNNLEGLLLPETYFVQHGDDEVKILGRMVSAFDTTASEIDLTGGAARLNLSPQQIVVVASIIEREAKVDDDRGKIARVIYNRLAKGMPLQIDATVQYALGENKPKLLNKDLEVNSPYNTYKVVGLPPGPIASPGRKSLEAALNPTPGAWLYYVLADATGRHNFADDAVQFERFKAEAKAKGLI